MNRIPDETEIIDPRPTVLCTALQIGRIPKHLRCRLALITRVLR
jgi:hypothetical protein